MMWVKEGHSMNEKMTPDGEPIIPVTEDEADDIRVTLETTTAISSARF